MNTSTRWLPTGDHGGEERGVTTHSPGASQRRLPDYSMRSKYEDADGPAFVTGTQAMVRLMLDQLRRDAAAGLNTSAFVSGYPGSPLGGLDLELARQKKLADDAGIHFVPGHNEELAATAVWGSQVAQTFDDALGSGTEMTLASTEPGRSVAVVSTTRTPTGRMVSDVSASWPETASSRGASKSAWAVGGHPSPPPRTDFVGTANTQIDKGQRLTNHLSGCPERIGTCAYSQRLTWQPRVPQESHSSILDR
jgi:hypothetical protein